MSINDILEWLFKWKYKQLIEIVLFFLMSINDILEWLFKCVAFKHGQMHNLCWTHRIFFQNLIKSTRNQIVFSTFRLIWIQTDVSLDPNQSENAEHNLILGWFNKTSKTFSVWSVSPLMAVRYNIYRWKSIQYL